MSHHKASTARLRTDAGCVAALIGLCAVSPAYTQADAPDCVRRFSQERFVTTNFEYALTVFAADLDGDGDNDVLSASRDTNTVAWFENTDGHANFGPPRVITTEAAGAQFAVAADFDGDGDLDVLAASEYDNTIAWHRNTDGLGTFAMQQVITTDAVGARAVFAADLDGDGDIDVLSASRHDDKIAWYENTDGLGTFGPQQVITTDANYAYAVHAADLDGDGDNDVLSASAYDDKIAWYENTDGLGTFGPQRLITTTSWARSVVAADLDGDGDNDVLSTGGWSSKIAWNENIDGLGTFGPDRVINATLLYGVSAFAIDLDGDGDNDVVSTSHSDEKMAWYENIDGLGSFSLQRVISDGEYAPNAVYAADLDGDGDIDLLTTRHHGDQIVWFENEPDCDANGIADGCEVPDCNRNFSPDVCDFASGISTDCNGNNVPDECDRDCNGNGYPDDCDLADGTSNDCNGNDVPDECDNDCNDNGWADECDLADGTSPDCNGNSIPDECDGDCNGDGVPDDCQGVIPPCPAVTSWGLVVMLLLGLSAGTLVFLRQTAPTST